MEKKERHYFLWDHILLWKSVFKNFKRGLGITFTKEKKRNWIRKEEKIMGFQLSQ